MEGCLQLSTTVVLYGTYLKSIASPHPPPLEAGQARPDLFRQQTCLHHECCVSKSNLTSQLGAGCSIPSLLRGPLKPADRFFIRRRANKPRHHLHAQHDLVVQVPDNCSLLSKGDSGVCESPVHVSLEKISRLLLVFSAPFFSSFFLFCRQPFEQLPCVPSHNR
jgi:hypothetical protein